jgi:hypothetical protein
MARIFSFGVGGDLMAKGEATAGNNAAALPEGMGGGLFGRKGGGPRKQR